MNNLREDDGLYTGSKMGREDILRAARGLGYTLPDHYVSLLEECNGGIPERRCLLTGFETSWAPDHFEITALYGFGAELSLECSDYLIQEWGYPSIGLVICATPSGGDDVVMLDYRNVHHGRSPEVVYVDDDRVPRRVAKSFSGFWESLTECRQVIPQCR